LLILDGFERALRAYSGMGAAYQGDELDPRVEQARRVSINPYADDFLGALGAYAHYLRGKVLMTTRLRPRAVERHNALLAGVREEKLKAMTKADAVAFFRAQGIRGSRAEIEAACAPYAFHPLSLRILAGCLVNDRRTPGDIAAARRLNITEDLVQNKHHILEVAYNSLSELERRVLGTLACFRTPTTYEAIESIFASGADGSPRPPEEDLDAILKTLESRGLIHWDRTSNKYDLHPIVRRYAYDRLTAPERQTAHRRLRDYFAAVPKPAKIERLSDLAPVIELYHHMVRAGQLDEAWILFRDRLWRTVYYQLGAYQTQTELLRALFTEESILPSLSKKAHQAHCLNELANAYALNGEPRRAVPLVEMANDIYENKTKNKQGLAIGLGNLANRNIELGALQAAEANLRRKIKMAVNEFNVAVGHRKLGRLLAYRGMWEEAEQELDIALRLFEKNKKIQSQGIVWAYRALHFLLLARESTTFDLQPVPPSLPILRSALTSARRALELADEFARTRYPVERDYVDAHWLLGAAHRTLAEAEPNESTAKEHLTHAERHLSEALRRCRAINAVYHEADILLEISKLRFLQGRREEALRLAQEARLVTERSGYVLQGADVHLWLARLALAGLTLTPSPSSERRGEPDGKEQAKQHAEKAKALATCDGPPHYYKVAYEEAESLLRALGA